MSAVPATAPHYVHNHFAHLKRVGQPKINAKHKVRVGKGGQKKKRKPGIVPETQRQWKVEELALRSTMKTERKTGSCSTNCSVSGFIHVCLSRFCFYFWISSLILVLILIFCLA